MTGEMHYINPETGEDSDGNIWESHLAIAKATGGTLKPFDQYQGPYIIVGGDLTVGNAPYAMPVQRLGIVRLWLTEDGVYREDTDQIEPCIPWIPETCAMAAMALMEG